MLVLESHKIVAAVWNVPPQQVHDRFEQEHKAIKRRWYTVIAIFCLLLLGAFLFATRQTGSRMHLERKESLLAKIDTTHSQLLAAIEEENSSMLGNRGYDGKLQALSEELKQLTNEFRVKFGTKALSDAEDKTPIRSTSYFSSIYGFAQGVEVTKEKGHVAPAKIAVTYTSGAKKIGLLLLNIQGTANQSKVYVKRTRKGGGKIMLYRDTLREIKDISGKYALNVININNRKGKAVQEKPPGS